MATSARAGWGRGVSGGGGAHVNTTETDMQMHASATHGLSRSPTRANFQKMPLNLRRGGQVCKEAGGGAATRRTRRGGAHPRDAAPPQAHVRACDLARTPLAPHLPLALRQQAWGCGDGGVRGGQPSFPRCKGLLARAAWRPRHPGATSRPLPPRHPPLSLT